MQSDGLKNAFEGPVRCLHHGAKARADAGDEAIKSRVTLHRPPKQEMRRVDFFFLKGLLAYCLCDLPFAAQNKVSERDQIALFVHEVLSGKNVKNEPAHHRARGFVRSEEHTSELQSLRHL